MTTGSVATAGDRRALRTCLCTTAVGRLGFHRDLRAPCMSGATMLVYSRSTAAGLSQTAAASPPRRARRSHRSRSFVPSPPTDTAEIWRLIQAQLRLAVTDTTDERGLAQLTPRTVDGHVVVVEAPGQVRTWISDRFADVLDDAAARVLGDEARVEL